MNATPFCRSSIPHCSQLLFIVNAIPNSLSVRQEAIVKQKGRTSHQAKFKLSQFFSKLPEAEGWEIREISEKRGGS
jgi:hypothetical protein